MRRLLLALAVGAALTPQSAEGQFVLRDDIDGWAWLAMVPDRDAVVQLVRGSPQTGDQSRLDTALVNELRNIGVRRVWGISEFDATESSVVGECTAVDWQPERTGGANVGIHAEISFWDHTRLAATEMYEALTFLTIDSDRLPDELLVQTCVTQLSNVFFRLGFNQG